MRVESPLADINFVIGDMRRDGDELVFSSSGESSLEAVVRMTPKDAAKMLGAFFKSPSAIGYALSLPFLWMRGGGSSSASSDADVRHPFDDLNDPWGAE